MASGRGVQDGNSFLTKEAAPDAVVARQIGTAETVVGYSIGFYCKQRKCTSPERVSFGSVPKK
jgi:hypothetical protein